MLVKTKAIVIATVKYQEKSLIVKCFTEKFGLKSYFVHNAFTGKKNNQKISFFQPLNQIEIEAFHKDKGNLERFKEVKISNAYQTIPFAIVKTTIALFLSEVLHNAIKEEGKNENLYAYLETSLLWFDSHDHVANFHLIFLLELTKYLGFSPENAASENQVFIPNEGVFSSEISENALSIDDSQLFQKLLLLKLHQPQQVFSTAQRQRLLAILLNYYALNSDGFKTIKSLQILKEIFN